MAALISKLLSDVRIKRLLFYCFKYVNEGKQKFIAQFLLRTDDMQIRTIIFDDDPQILNMLTLILEMRGYEVLSFSEPLACPIYDCPTCECPQEEACTDFLITDNQMPRMTGLEFIEQQQIRGCKAEIANKAIISGSWDSDCLEKAHHLECKIFSKPLSVHEILEWLEDRAKDIDPSRKLIHLKTAV